MAFLQSAPRIELSPQEMLVISRTIRREFAPRFVRRDAVCSRPMTFSPQELLDISREISREFAPCPAENRSKLVLLPVDPRRLHAYWHLAENGVSLIPKPAADERLTLRVFMQPEPPLQTGQIAEEPHWFDVAVDKARSRQEVTLPAEAATSTYRAAIGLSREDGGFAALAYSNSADTPAPRPHPDDSGLSAAVSRFIMPSLNVSSPTGKTSPNQEK